MSSEIIKFENVNFFYEKGRPAETQALKDINLSIKKGDYVAFFGPSGCGKSTLLYTIAGIEQASSGRVLINNRDLTEFTKQELAIYRQIGVGIIFQNFNLIPSINVWENIALPMAFLGISFEVRKKRALTILERLGLNGLANRYPHELSGGQQQRVGVARAMSNNPPLILADEPLGNLDSVNANKVLDFLRELNQKDGQTIVMVTHEAWSLRDVQKIFYMRDGVITRVESKSPETIKKGASSYYYKKLFPELPVAETRAKTIAQYVLRGYSEEEIKRLEYFLIQLLKKQIDLDIFKAVLDRPYKNGGVGLWRQKAEKLTAEVEEMIKREESLKSLFERMNNNPNAPIKAEIEDIQNWLTKSFKGKMTAYQKLQISEIIEERLRNVINSDHFLKTLNLSKSLGGVGLKIGSSLKMKDKLESILGQKEKDKEKTEVENIISQT
ncbi:ABC transporter ATP-binding protein [Patescibacteria group bacterium]|nr:ABC transporter ATP-binding protein [Patescibacteria group bacterium]